MSWDEAGVEDVARFVAWLRAPAGNVIVLADGAGVCGPATVNRYLAGVFGFYDHYARTGLGTAAELVSWRRISRGSYKPFLHHNQRRQPIRRSGRDPGHRPYARIRPKPRKQTLEAARRIAAEHFAFVDEAHNGPRGIPEFTRAVVNNPFWDLWWD